MREFLAGFRYDAHPMGMLLGCVGALSTFYPDAKAIDDEGERHMAAVRLIAKVPTLAAFAYRHSLGLPYIYPDNDLSYPGNFLSMLYKMTEVKYEPDPRLERALDVLWILHADHEQNCSTSAVRAVGSSEVDPYSAVAAGVAALYGPLHGGANEAVLRMLDRIETVENIPDFLQGVKDRKEKLMGFGHRVYKNYDPRARIIKKNVEEVFEVTGKNPKIEIAVELEKRALDDEFFTERKLYPNVDFYSGLIYEALADPDRHVHGDVRHPAHLRLDRAVARDGARTRRRRSPGRARSTRASATATTCRSTSASLNVVEPLLDGHGRLIQDLRVSVTDRCNFRCQYCMPAEGLPWLERDAILTFEEIERLVSLFVRLGITDVRLTGGEPLVRKEFPRLAAKLALIDGIEDLSVTTNGYLLERDADALVAAGIQRVNVSIDSLQRDRFYAMTRRDALPQVLRGLEALGRHPAADGEGQRRRDARLHRGGGAAVRRVRPHAPVPGPLHRVHAARRRPRVDAGLGADGRGAPRAHPRALPARGAAARAVGHRARVPVRRRRRRDRVHQPGLGAVLLGLQPDPADGRGRAAHLPLLAARDGPARAAALRRERRGARDDHPRRRLAQGAEAPCGRAGIHPARPHDVRDRGLARSAARPAACRMRSAGGM